MSTNTGEAPTLVTASEVEIHEIAGTKTSSPLPIPIAFSNISIESVPLAQAIKCLTPKYALNSSSNFKILF